MAKKGCPYVKLKILIPTVTPSLVRFIGILIALFRLGGHSSSASLHAYHRKSASENLGKPWGIYSDNKKEILIFFYFVIILDIVKFLPYKYIPLYTEIERFGSINNSINKGLFL